MRQGSPSFCLIFSRCEIHILGVVLQAGTDSIRRLGVQEYLNTPLDFDDRLVRIARVLESQYLARATYRE